MSVLFWFLLLLAPAVAIGYVVWAYRRKADERDSASRERYAALVGISRGTGAPTGAAPKDQPGSAAVANPAVPVAASAKIRDRFLTQPETLLYYVLKAGLPELEVFPRVGLASVLDVTDARSPVPIPRHDLDFLICDKSMRVIAVVLLDGRTSGPTAASIGQSLGAAGVRLVRVNPAALPKREQVKALVLGE